MDNLSFASKPKEKIKEEIKIENKIEYTGPEYKIGDIVITKFKGETCNGVIIKNINNENYWVALYDTPNRYNHMPCELLVVNKINMKLVNVSSN